MLAAAQSFATVLKVLSGMPDQAIVTPGEATVAGLKELARMQMERGAA